MTLNKKRSISPRTTDKTYDWYKTTFDNPNQGAEYALEALPELYRRVLFDLRGIFTAGELSLMLDVQNGCFLMPQMAGQHLTANCEDGITIEQYDKKWKISNPKDFLKRLHSRSNFEIAVLEIWAGAFWKQDGKKLEEWVLPLASEEKGKKAKK